jgi:hypothetical protein
MDKKDILILILVVLLGISAYFFFSQEEQKDLVFENNLKCAQYIDQQNEEINEIADLPINEGKVVTAPKVFYSPVLNTCVSAFSINDFGEDGFSSFYINDLLTNDSIFTSGGTEGQPARDNYRKKLSELSGELEVE